MSTRYAGTKAEMRALNAYICLVRAAESSVARLSLLLTAHDLSPSQFGVLEAVLHLGPLSQRELGAKLLRSSGNMTLVVDNLERRGLARRVRDDRDRRVATVHLTDKGRKLVERVFPDHVAAIVAEMSVLAPAEQDELRRLARRVGLRGEA